MFLVDVMHIEPKIETYYLLYMRSLCTVLSEWLGSFAIGSIMIQLSDSCYIFYVNCKQRMIHSRKITLLLVLTFTIKIFCLESVKRRSLKYELLKWKHFPVFQSVGPMFYLSVGLSVLRSFSLLVCWLRLI